MKPRPIRMPDSLWDELTEEADEQNLGTAEYVRQILRTRDANTQPNTQPNTAALEERIVKVEQELKQLTSAETLPDTEPDTLSDTDVASEFDWNEIGYAERPERVEALVAVVEHLREHGQARTPELVDVAEEHGVSVGTPARLISDALKQLDEVDTPEPGSNVYTIR